MTVRRGLVRPRGWVRAVAFGVALILLGSAQSGAAASAASGWLGLGWDLPPLQENRSVDGVDGGFRAAGGASVAPFTAAGVNWPAAATSEVDLSTAAPKAVAGQPVALRRGHAGKSPTTADGKSGMGKVKVTTLDQDSTAKTGIKGVLMQVSPVSGDTGGALSVDIDYRGFAAAYGGDYGGRLHLVQYPPCLLTTPEKSECRVGTALESKNDAKNRHVSGDVTLASTETASAARAAAPSVVVAAEAETKGGGGDYGATDMKPAGSWTAGGSSADFNYSYPIGTPAALGGTGPSVSLNYSSSSVDGLTSATNNQTSGVGDGWSLSGGGFIERSYKGCGQDLGGNNNQTKTGDLCWFNDNATISFSGANGELILDKDNGTWHPKDDDGTRVERLTNTVNGDKFNEYWKVTTPDGTQYFFGLNRLPGWASGKAETQSTWTVPVFGNNDKEPCHAATYAASWCQRAWRWNLDYVVDPHGNALGYYYQPETNYYGLNRNASTANDPGTVYTRGGYLTKIEYGFNTHVADTFSHAPAQVLFDTAERCVPSGTITCDPAQLNKNTATSWPDVPSETVCAQGAVCTYGGPSFFSRKRYTKIRTTVTDGGAGWKPVGEWALGQSFPPTGDGNRAALWLDSITETGKIASPATTGGDITLPPTTFHGKAMANRVNANSNYTALTRNRIDSITNPQGGLTTVTYADPECVSGTHMPASPETNTMSCYPVYWTPAGATDPVLDWFNKFRVINVIEDANTTQQPQKKVTHYDYLGGAAWHRDDDNPLSDPKYRTWSEWRGYGDVKTTVGLGPAGGDPSGPPVVTESIYLRGMEGVPVASANWGETVNDRKELAGFTRETITYRDGKMIGGTLADPWVSAATAIDANGRSAAYTDTETSRNRVWLATANKWRISKTHTTFGKYGLPTTVQNEGDTSDPAQTSCTITQYLENTTAWLLTFSKEIQKISGACDDKTNPPGPGNIISDSRTCYDKQAFGVAPTVGNVTQIDGLSSWAAGGAEAFKSPNAKAEFDDYGRTVSATDALGLVTTTTYTPATGGPMTQVDTTTPQISDTNTTKLTSTKYLDPVSGAVIAEKNGSGLRTDVTHDALGRTLAVWKPGHDKALNAPADVTYAYTISNKNGLSNVATKTLLADGTYSTSYSLIDGLGRTVQTQAPSPQAAGGRVVVDTLYDSQGRVYKTHNAYWNSAAPSSTLFVVQDNAVPNTTQTTFDGSGTAIVSAYLLNGSEQWRTTTVPDGDRTTTIPPAGGTASTTITNGLGQATQLLQYKDPAKYTAGSPADVTTYTYTRSGKQASVTDTTGKNVWTFGYDPQDRKISSTDPDTGTTTFTYDDAGKLLTTTDARKRTVAYTYDGLGRKTAEFDGSLTGTKLAEWTYDTLLLGTATGSIRYSGGKAYKKEVTGYDTAGRPTGSKVTIPAGVAGLSGTYTFGITYDPNSGAVRTTNSPAKGRLPDEETSFTYSKLGSPLTMMTADSSATATTLVSGTTYNSFGQVLRTNFNDSTNPYQVSVTNTYANGTNRLETVQAQRSTSANYWIADRTYTYDPVGNLTKIADIPPGTTADVQCFRQDYLQRLIEAWTPAAGDCATQPSVAGIGGASPYWTSWALDDTGNRKTQVQHTSAGNVTSTSTYPAPGGLKPHAVQAVSTEGPSGTTETDYGYDEVGSAISRGPAGAAQTFTYDAEGRIDSATEANGAKSTYLYDADGALLLTTEPTGTTLMAGDMELTVPTGGTAALGTRFYSYNGQVIAERKGDIGLTWKLTDHQGTTYATVDAANLAVTKRWQDPFGLTRGTSPSTWPDKHGFVGGYQATTGLTHLGAREYDPATGRFLSVDPVLDTGNPQSMNGYSYANNNPINSSDPTGLMWGAECGPDGVLCGTGEAESDPNYIDNRAYFMQKKGYSQQSIDSFRHIASNSRCRHECTRAQFVAHHSPVTNDRRRLADFLNYGSSGNSQDFWNIEIGEPVDGKNSLSHACFGETACARALVYLNDTNDIEGAKAIAALYCVDNFDECLKASKVKYWIDSIYHEALDSAAIGAAGEVGAAEGVIEGESLGLAESEGEGYAGLRSAGCNSFAAGTPVLLADGSAKPIEQVEVGDEVMNSVAGSDITQKHAVVGLHVTDDDRDFVDISMMTTEGARIIVSTAHHRFWDPVAKLWTDAADLKVGGRLAAPRGGVARISSLRHYASSMRTYNLSIEDVHTYYVEVGRVPVLVHNAGECRVSGLPHGALGEAATFNRLVKEGYSSISREVQFRDSLGRNFRADFVARNPQGEWVAIEVKTGKGATVSPNQASGYPELTGSGAVLDTTKLSRYGMQKGQTVQMKLEIDSWTCGECGR